MLELGFPRRNTPVPVMTGGGRNIFAAERRKAGNEDIHQGRKDG